MIIANLCDKEKITLVELNHLDIGELLQDERPFKIFINDRLFFQDDYFPILEFTCYALDWLNSFHLDFVYNTIESEDQPILAFCCVEGKWSIFSAWQKFKSNDTFSFLEVKTFIEQIVDKVVEKTREDKGTVPLS